MEQTHSNFTIYNASAGSGKTFTLVTKYLVLLFKSKKLDKYRNILAITFTNKAVEEMKTRILESLYAFSKDPCPSNFEALKNAVAAETHLDDEKLRTKAQFILKNIIHNYAAFEISTIDGFTHRVLRTFAKDLGIPLNFEVELDTEKILQEAVEHVINRAGEDKELTDTLVNFTLSKTDEDKSWDITYNLFEVARLLTNENNQRHLKELKNKTLADFSEFSKALNKKLKFLKDELEQDGNAFFIFINNEGIEPEDFKSGYLSKFYIKVKEKHFSTIRFGADWQENIDSEPLYAKKLASDKKAILDKIQSEIAARFVKTKEDLVTLEFLSEVKKQLSPLSVLNIINQEIQKIKEERSLLLISEFNATISNAIKDQPVPFIYERLGERYQNYFIDEFQDTSELQWQNLIPLIDHTLSGQNPEKEEGGLTIVGDAKQSIYRWRGGKAEQFMNLYNGGNPFSTEGKNVVNLPNNYRSCSEIVQFNNEFFAHVSTFLTQEEHMDLFQNSSKQEPCKEERGYVNISFIEAENAEEEMEVYPERVLEIVLDLEKEKIPKKDICILTRRRKEGVAIANILNENGISIISSETLLVAQSPQVHFINSVLQFGIYPQDGNLKYEILDFIASEVVEEENSHQLISENLPYDGDALFRFLKKFEIDFSLKEVQSLSLYESVEYIIKSFNLVETSDAYVQSYLDFVYEATQKTSGGILEFLELWEQKKDKLSIVAPKGEDAVQIMTIHSSKGLEFPVVIYPFANNQIDDVKRESLWIANPDELNQIPSSYIGAAQKMKNWQEDAALAYEELLCQTQLDAANVLYVALTRPVNRLYVVSKLDLNKKGEESSNKISGLLINFLKKKKLWKDDSLEYEIGEKSVVTEEKSETTVTSLKQKKFFSSQPKDHGVNIITKAGLLWDTSQQEAIERGHIIHDIFAKIKTAEDVDQAIENAIKEGVFTNLEKENIHSTITAVVSDPLVKEYFSGNWHVHNEQDIISDYGILRPDRINIQEQKAVVIDYKTGEFNKKHEQQILQYAQVLEEMEFVVEKKILVYISENSNISKPKIVIL